MRPSTCVVRKPPVGDYLDNGRMGWTARGRLRPWSQPPGRASNGPAPCGCYAQHTCLSVPATGQLGPTRCCPSPRPIRRPKPVVHADRLRTAVPGPEADIERVRFGAAKRSSEPSAMGWTPNAPFEESPPVLLPSVDSCVEPRTGSDVHRLHHSSPSPRGLKACADSQSIPLPKASDPRFAE